MDESLEPLGPIVRLQVQIDQLKIGDPRRYEPGPITPVDRLLIEPGGVTGLTSEGMALLDVHHRTHPRSRFRGDNGISIGFTGHYRAMRNRFGEGPGDGAAGENLLVDDVRVHDEHRFAGGVVIEGANGVVRLETVAAAAPCVEFTRYCLGATSEQAEREAVAAGLDFLGGGMRGFYAVLEGDAAQVEVGDVAYALI